MSETNGAVIRMHLASGTEIEVHPVDAVPDFMTGRRRGWLTWHEDQDGVERVVSVKARRIAASELTGIDSADLPELQRALHGSRRGYDSRQPQWGMLAQTIVSFGALFLLVRELRRRRARGTDSVETVT